MSHTITITKLPDEDSDDVEYTVAGTCEPECIVWPLCKRKACQTMDPGWAERRQRHGKEHYFNPDIGWCIEGTECGEHYAHNLLLDAERANTLGTFPLSIEWDGDQWNSYIDTDNPIIAEEDKCQTVMVDGVPVRVLGAGEWNDADSAAFLQIVRAVRARAAAESPNG